MSCFTWKKKRKSQTQRLEDSWEPVYGFPHRLPFEGYRPEFYHVYHKLEDEELRPALDTHLERLFAGAVDDGNGNLLDDLIFCAAREALPDLERQRASHMDIIRRLSVRFRADRSDFQEMADRAEADVEVLEREYREICRKLDLYHNGDRKEEQYED